MNRRRLALACLAGLLASADLQGQAPAGRALSIVPVYVPL